MMLLKTFYTNYIHKYMQRHYVQGYVIIPWLRGHAVVYVVGGDVCMLSCNAYTQFPYKPCMYTSHVVHNVHMYKHRISILPLSVGRHVLYMTVY